MDSKINIPYFGIDRLYKNHSADILQCVESVFESGKVLMGPEVELFEKKIASYCERKYAIAVGSCTDALYFALVSAGIKPGDEVIVTSFSFIASVSPILRAGAIPVFTDITENNMMMDIKSIQKLITDKTKAILGVHLFGNILNIEELEIVAQENNLILIEDAAQSLGAESKGRKAGNMGDLSCVSFDPTKIIGAFGNGGVVLTDNENYFSTIKQLRYHGKSLTGNHYELLGYNSRMATSQASILVYELDQLYNWIEQRNKIAEFYINELKEISALTIPEISGTSKQVFHKFVIRTEKRDELKSYMESKGIQTMIHYEKALFEQPLFKDHEFKAEELEIVMKEKKKVLSLPIYPELTKVEISYICNNIKEFFEQC